LGFTKDSKDHELPENARPITKFVRQAIDLKALDNVGIDLSGNKGTGDFSSFGGSGSGIRSTNPPTLAPPPLTSLPFAPPPISDLPPPPPIDFDMPPPPPPRD
jgi:hypothetical protein